MLKEMNEQVKVFALGGVGEIGKNMYVVEVGDLIYVLDAGLKFPDQEMYGIDHVIPDVSYLEKNAHKVVGVFITHGHEDHIGAIPYIMNKLPHVKFYTNKLAYLFIREKLSEKGIKNLEQFELYDETTLLTFENSSISFFRTTHSIPDSFGFCVNTPQGAVVFTGDFKFDQSKSPYPGADLGKLALIGDKGVLCLLSDSTNAERQGFSGSEKKVSEEIKKEIMNAKGRVLVACFSSNIYRIQQVINASEAAGRKLAVVGSSMMKSIELAKELDYLSIPDDLMISVVDTDNYKERDIVILTTGTQGEPMAALSKIAKGTHKQVSIRKGDTVLMAATAIPGNEMLVGSTVNLLFRAGANVIYGYKKVHVSGHGYEEELKLMLELMKPKYFIPVHGEFRMQKAHSHIAEEVGIAKEDIFIIEKGDIVSFKNGQATRTEKIEVGNVLIDGIGVGDVGNIVLRDRKLLSQDGILIVVVTFNKQKKAIISGPEIITRGFVYVRESEKLITRSTEIVKDITEKMLQNDQIEWTLLKNSIRDGLSAYLYEETKRRPMILPILMEV
ncbi:ribonuclease J [Bacillus sp. AFS055030]|uniref:ribonuclease J n=1 Tax=Bacillus sp. AFS055030 TaxID=2033507 RepID=UPI000BFCDBEC|nr:ribonuclease J [Bacillus sp. AFS055030]PGL67974.1 Zn-dependent hydrolase [Bacillus sp. AFS055030]